MSHRSSDPSIIRAIDLFCGAGGTSTGLALACEALGKDVELAVVDHWDRALETHRANHPWAMHFDAKVEELDPRDIFDAERVDILVASPECTHFSSARGSRPVEDQRRASAFHVLRWLELLDVENVLIENVPEFESWGPVGADGMPLESKKGSLFTVFVRALRALGYAVQWRVLNAADYGDATTRRRLFIIGRRNYQPRFPTLTHSETGGGLPRWRSAAEIIDWSDVGESIWERTRPLANSTMRRIAEGIRQRAHPMMEPFADVLAELTPDDVREMQENAVAAQEAANVEGGRLGAFLVKPDAQNRGSGRLVSSHLVPFFGERATQSPRTHDLREPAAAVTGHGAGAIADAFLVSYYGHGQARDVGEPCPTVTTRDRFALVLPNLDPWGLDVRFRMLQPRELALAMGFPREYQFCGTKTEVVKQIGNAVPVHLARALVLKLLTGQDPMFDVEPPRMPEFVAERYLEQEASP